MRSRGNLSSILTLKLWWIFTNTITNCNLFWDIISWFAQDISLKAVLFLPLFLNQSDHKESFKTGNVSWIPSLLSLDWFFILFYCINQNQCLRRSREKKTVVLALKPQLLLLGSEVEAKTVTPTKQRNNEQQRELFVGLSNFTASSVQLTLSHTASAWN